MRRAFGFGLRNGHARSRAYPDLFEDAIELPGRAALTLGEISKLATGDLPDKELTTRKASLNGNFARGLETTSGLVTQVSSLAIYGVNFDQLNQFVGNVQAVKAEDVKDFAAKHLNIDSTSVIVVGDARKFLPALQKQFPQVEVIPVGELDLNTASLRRAVSKN